MPGPLLTVTINESYRRGFVAAPLLVAGHAVLEATLIVLLVLGLDRVVGNDLFFGVVGVAGNGFFWGGGGGGGGGPSSSGWGWAWPST